MNPDIANRFVALEARLATVEATNVALEAELIRLKRHIHNTSPSHHQTGGPIVGSIR
jgi:hypothetical protein